MFREAAIECDQSEACGAGEGGEVCVGPEVGADTAWGCEVSPTAFEAVGFFDEAKVFAFEQAIRHMPGGGACEGVTAHDRWVRQQAEQTHLRDPVEDDPVAGCL